MTEYQCHAAVLHDRTIPDSDAQGNAGGGQMDAFNILFIVGFALLITVLARYLARRANRRD